MNGNALCVHCLRSALATHLRRVIRLLIEECFSFVLVLCFPNDIYCIVVITSAG